MPGANSIERRGHRVWVLVQIENRAVVKEATPLRIEADEFEVIFQAPARLRENAPQHRWNGHNGGAGVETEARALDHGGFAAQPLVALEEDDLVAAGGEGAGGRESAESAADDANAFVL